MDRRDILTLAGVCALSGLAIGANAQQRIEVPTSGPHVGIARR
jgi:hypothetical protein